MNRYKKELDHEKQITAIMCMVCPDHRLMKWKIEKLLRHGYPIEKIVKIVKRYCKGGEDCTNCGAEIEYRIPLDNDTCE